jgi:DNA-binding response OmpR family regulator
MANILIVEDDLNLRILMNMRLKNKYDIFLAENGAKALEIIERETIHLIITDIMMPDVDGYALVETLRARGVLTPVIMLSAKDGLPDKGRGFAVGADDYLTKPVNFEELTWRIDALLRRSKIANEGKITIGAVTVDKQSFTVTRGEQVFELPSKEFQLLYLLLSYPGKIFTKENILDSVWGYSSESDEYTVRTHINRLRNKFENFPEFEIITIRGVGYKAIIKV